MVNAKLIISKKVFGEKKEVTLQKRCKQNMRHQNPTFFGGKETCMYTHWDDTFENLRFQQGMITTISFLSVRSIMTSSLQEVMIGFSKKSFST